MTSLKSSEASAQEELEARSASRLALRHRLASQMKVGPLRWCLIWFLHLCRPWVLQAQRPGLKKAHVPHWMAWEEATERRGWGLPASARQAGQLGEPARAPLTQVVESFLPAPRTVFLSLGREQMLLSGAVITGCRAGPHR